jgi:putative transposase
MDIYHALNRGVDKRVIFLDSQDYARFVHDMFEFNSLLPANNTRRKSMVDFVSRPYEDTDDADAKLVDIHGWCLMPNHYHLLLSEQAEGGIRTFLRRLNIGYAKYFNERYKRSGTLFQGRTKKILISKEAHFIHILHYIHLNPLDLKTGSRQWRQGTITNKAESIDYLTTYRWSSYQDYAGTRNFPSILTQDLFQDFFDGRYAEVLDSYLQNIDTSLAAEQYLE